MTIIAPIMMLRPSATGAKSFGTLVIKYTAISGDHEPKINPALYENPAALFRSIVGKRSEKNAGIGPDAVDMTKAYNITTIGVVTLFCKINVASGIETKIDVAQKTRIAFFLPIFCDNTPVKIMPSHDDVVA